MERSMAVSTAVTAAELVCLLFTAAATAARDAAVTNACPVHVHFVPPCFKQKSTHAMFTLLNHVEMCRRWLPMGRHTWTLPVA